jgi:hypothetical protein
VSYRLCKQDYETEEEAQQRAVDPLMNELIMSKAVCSPLLTSLGSLLTHNGNKHPDLSQSNRKRAKTEI